MPNVTSPEEMRPAFAASHRQWLISTDFERSVAVLKAGLADATADAGCETLLLAHDVGGTDVQRRLTALVGPSRRPPGPQGRARRAGGGPLGVDALIDANRHRLVQRDNPDLVLPGPVFGVPAP